MALKKAVVTFTNQFGDVVTRHLPIQSVVFNYAEGYVEVIFASFASEAARAAGATPEYFSQRIKIDGTSQSEMGLILAVSDALWTKIADAPFINDHAEVDKTTGKQVAKQKSLAASTHRSLTSHNNTTKRKIKWKTKLPQPPS
jgi:hypothetical protein